MLQAWRFVFLVFCNVRFDPKTKISESTSMIQKASALTTFNTTETEVPVADKVRFAEKEEVIEVSHHDLTPPPPPSS